MRSQWPFFFMKYIRSRLRLGRQQHHYSLITEKKWKLRNQSHYNSSILIPVICRLPIRVLSHVYAFTSFYMAEAYSVSVTYLTTLVRERQAVTHLWKIVSMGEHPIINRNSKYIKQGLNVENLFAYVSNWNYSAFYSGV